MLRTADDSVARDRYELYEPLGAGGMGTVHLGRVRLAAGLARIVAIKRLNTGATFDDEAAARFLDEARLAMRIRHPNVVPSFDVVDTEGEVLLVMEYVHGESLAHLIRATARHEELVSPAVAVAIMSNVLYGLHAAHEAVDERGEPLDLVHRDVSPQNVIVGADGIARVIDFGIAKAAGRLLATASGAAIKGKLAYLAPEQLTGRSVDRRADVFAAGLLTWELLTAKRLFRGETEADLIREVLLAEARPPSTQRGDLPPALDAVVMKALSAEPSARFASAREMAAELLRACGAAAPHVVAEWVDGIAHERLAARALRIAELEGSAVSTVRAVLGPSPPAREGSSSDAPTIGTSARKTRIGRMSLYVGGALALACGALIGAWRAGLASSASAAHTPPVDVPPWRSPAPLSTSGPAIALSSAPPSTAEVEPPPAASATSRRTGADRRSWAPPTTPAGACDPPYTRAPDGTKVWRRECFGAR